MKLIASFSFFCMFISSNLLYSQTIKTDTTAHFRLELGAAIGVGAMALNYINVSEKTVATVAAVAAVLSDFRPIF